MRDEAPYLEKAREIHPAAPAAAVGELLTLSEARVVPLPAGDLCKGYGQSGTYVLAAAVRGNLTVATEGRYEMLHPGQAIALRSPGAYTLQAVSSCLGMTVHLQGDAASRLLKLHNGAALFSRGAAIVREAVMVLAVLDEEHPPVDGADASARGFALLTKLCAAPAGQSEFGILSPVVESAVGIIQEEFPFLEGLDELSKRLEVSKAHLIRTFTKATGISPGKYITRVRIEYAKLLLQDVDVTISYVAEASGFANTNYFAKVFRKETGMSPSEYLEAAPKRQGGLGPGDLAPW